MSRLQPFELDPTIAKLEPEVDEQAVAVTTQPLPPRRRWRGPAMAALSLGLLGLLLLQAVIYVRGLLETMPVFGVPFAILLAIVTIAAVLLIGREWRDLRRLSRRSVLREQAVRMVGSELHGEAEPLVKAVADELAKGIAGTSRSLQLYREQGSDTLTDGERLVLFERTVLAPVDRQAYRLVLKSSRDIGVLTAISPLGLLDGLLVLWRTMLLLRQVMTLYGVAPGTVASLSLARRCLRNAALAGLADVVTQATLEHAGASLMTLLSARAGQGIGNALLASRLGLEAIKETRPLPFVATELPRLSHIRKALVDRAEPEDIVPDDRPPRP